MRVWGRAKRHYRCGQCGGDIQTGDPLCAIQIGSIKKPRLRCATCAGEPVPVLAPIVEYAPIDSHAFEPVRQILPRAVAEVISTPDDQAEEWYNR